MLEVAPVALMGCSNSSSTGILAGPITALCECGEQMLGSWRERLHAAAFVHCLPSASIAQSSLLICRLTATRTQLSFITPECLRILSTKVSSNSVITSGFC